MRTQMLLPLAGILSTTLLAGCGGMSNATNPAGQTLTPMQIDFNRNGFVSDATTKAVGVRLDVKPLSNKVYGKVLGYFNGTTSTKTQIVTIRVGSKVVFHNVDDNDTHTASFLGVASKQGAMFPSKFNGSATQSAAGTDVATSRFSTGPLSPGKNSLVYTANTAGYYMFGCAFHYDSNGMRDIIIVR